MNDSGENPTREGPSLTGSTKIGTTLDAANLKDQAMIRNTVAAGPERKKRQWPLTQEKMDEVFRAEQWALRKGLESGDAPLVNSVVRTFVGMHGQNQADEPRTPQVVVNTTAIANATAQSQAVTDAESGLRALHADPVALEALRTLRKRMARRGELPAVPPPAVEHVNGHANGHINGTVNGNGTAH